MKINQIWENLENDKSFSHGLILRRYSSAVTPDVFVAIKLPEKFRCIAASISNSVKINLSTFTRLKDLSIELIPDESKSEKNILLLKLLNIQNKDIFSVLCEDLMSNISSMTNEGTLVKELLNRFEKWASLFDKATSQGLSAEEQRGLYGELFFLRKFLQVHPDFMNILNSWVGPERQIRDFQSDNWSLEVKTTCDNNHQKVHVSSERQLDTVNLEALFLYHISLETRQNSGETLNDIVQYILDLLSPDLTSQNRFRNKLLEAGYFDHHRNIYDKTGYFIRQDFFYKVEKNFPRIEENDIRDGVGDVKYSIVISQCSGFKRTDEQVFKSLLFQ